MSLESILSHILNKADAEREKIIREARIEAESIIKEANLEAEKLYQGILDKETALSDRQKQRLLVNARLESKKNLLKAKQELVDSVFEKLQSAFPEGKFKKQRVSPDKVQEIVENVDFYLNKIRLDYEIEIAEILFA